MPTFLALALLLSAPTASVQSAEPLDGSYTPLDGAVTEDGADVEAFGVLRRIGLLCVAFESDAGELYALVDRGGLQAGDRVFVRGSFAGPGVCGSLIVNRLDNTIEPAFAGTGTLVADRTPWPALETPEGARYRLFGRSSFSTGDEVFVRGAVRTYENPITGVLEPWIVTRAIGAPFSGYGRLVDGTGPWSVRLQDGTLLALDGPGYAFAEDGQFVFVEGTLDLATDPPTLCHNTARRAFEAPGEIVDAGGGVPAFKAETILFDDVFALESFGSFAIGERAFVRGRRLDDYDPLEVRSNLIRGSSIDVEFSACGTLVADATGGGVSFQATTGETFELETLGDITTEPFVYVAGAVDASGTRFEHNLIAPCFELSGTLEQGFECTPLFVAAGAPRGASLLLLENLGPYGLGDSFCVQGGVTACDAGCPVPCMVANTTSNCTQ